MQTPPVEGGARIFIGAGRLAASGPENHGHQGFESLPLYQGYTGKLALLCSPKAVPTARNCTDERDQIRQSVGFMRLHANNGTGGFYIWPRGGRVSDEVVELLLGRNDVQPFDSGLFPGHPESWRLGNWREWGRP
jgi:hypothetical protein